MILLLTMAEYMARKEAILSQAPEFFGMRSTKFRDAIIAYDLTAIALSRVRSFRLVVNINFLFIYMIGSFGYEF